MPHSGHSPSGKASTSLVAALFHSVWDSNPLILGSNRAIGFRHVLPRAATKWSGSPGATFRQLTGTFSKSRRRHKM